VIVQDAHLGDSVISRIYPLIGVVVMREKAEMLVSPGELKSAFGIRHTRSLPAEDRQAVDAQALNDSRTSARPKDATPDLFGCVCLARLLLDPFRGLSCSE